MTTIDTMPTLATIPATECRRLLGTACLGRLGFVHDGTPEILPVNYVLDGDAIVFASNTGTKLWAATRGFVVFEVDQTDSRSRSG